MECSWMFNPNHIDISILYLLKENYMPSRLVKLAGNPSVDVSPCWRQYKSIYKSIHPLAKLAYKQYHYTIVPFYSWFTYSKWWFVCIILFLDVRVYQRYPSIFFHIFRTPWVFPMGISGFSRGTARALESTAPSPCCRACFLPIFDRKEMVSFLMGYEWLVTNHNQ